MRREYRQGELYVEDVALEAIAAAHGTPCYVYSAHAILSRWREYDVAFGARAHRVCYAVKANDNLSILRLLARAGAGFDIVSGGELARVQAAAGNATVIFSGVGKSVAEIAAAVASGVFCINVESSAELERVSAAARAAGRRVPVALRVNPDVDPQTHPYIATGLKENKFGVPIAQAPELYAAIAADPALEAVGVASHIGSQLTSIAPIVAAIRETVALAAALGRRGIPLRHIDIGGGLGIRYQDETPPPIAQMVRAVCAEVPEHYTVILEPGRSIIAAAGLLLTAVEYVKPTAVKTFAIVDAAMNDLIRPALYGAWHAVQAVRETVPGALATECDIVGPICETGDWLARGRQLPLQPGALLAILDCGAYGFAMASNYNARPRPPEVLVDGDGFRLVRARETLGEMLANEQACLIP